jgi:hypothetical protein
MPTEEQDKSMSLDQIRENIRLAKSTNLYPIDLWGGEWWCWRQKHGDTLFAECVKQQLA